MTKSNVRYTKKALVKMNTKQLVAVCKQGVLPCNPEDLPKFSTFAQWESYLLEVETILEDKEDKNPIASYENALAELHNLIPENWVLIARRVSAELLTDGYLTTVEELKEKLGKENISNLQLVGGITACDGSYDPSGHGVRVSRDKLNRELVEGMFHVEYPETRGFKNKNIITYSY